MLEIDENIHPCKGCSDYNPLDSDHSCMSNGGCGREMYYNELHKLRESIFKWKTDNSEEEERIVTCKCYHADKNFLGSIGVCWGTKECEACSCGGDELKCDFYAHVRERAKKKAENEVCGKWNFVRCEDFICPFICPNCGKTAPFAYNFCPHCGEKMR